MKLNKIAFCMALVGLLALGGQAFALIGTADDVPAATLLLPYFEVDLDNPAADTTLFAVGNASAAPAIAHVTLWTDLSVPTLDFNVYLTGYDIVTFNLRDLFIDGIVPATEHDDGVNSPIGIFSLTTNPVTGVGPGTASCDDQLPPPPLPASLLAHIRAAHTGQASNIFLGDCSAVDHGDNIARGYITIDNVSSCSLEFPGAAGYFVQGGQGTAVNVNQLYGDYFYADTVNNFAQGETLVHVEADSTLVAPDYTFYRRFTPASGADNREALSSTFAARYAAGQFAPGFPGGTDLIVWRDSKSVIAPFTCGTLPSPFPLGQEQIVIFDEMENPNVPVTPPFSPPPPGEFLLPFPWETQVTTVGGVDLPVPFDFGWLYLNLNSVTATQTFDPTPDPASMQNWVTDKWSAGGRFSVGFDAIQLDNVTFGGTNVSLPVCDGAPDPAACN